MTQVKEMVDHFERLISDTNKESLVVSQESYEDDDLLSYDDSESDVTDEIKIENNTIDKTNNNDNDDKNKDNDNYNSKPIEESRNEQNESKMIQDIQCRDKDDCHDDALLKEDDPTLATTLETPTNSFRNLEEDEYNLVYSSDDDDTTCCIPRQSSSPLAALKSIDEEGHGNNNLDPFQSFRTTTSTDTYYEEHRSFDVINDQGQSPLTIASMNCSAEAMKLFISKGFDVNLRDVNGSTPLHYTCMFESSEDQQICMKLLLENGAYVNFQDYQGRTPLHKAATNNSIANIELLLSHGACPRIPDNEGNIPLHEVTKAMNIEAIELLSQPNMKCHSSCAWCAAFRTNNSNNNLGDENGFCTKEEEDVGNDDNDASLNPKSLEIWNRFFENAVNSDEDNIHESKNESQEGESSCTTTYEAEYPLHNSIYMGDINLTKDLIQSGCDVNQLDDNKNSPLHVAAFNGDLLTMELLVNHGATIDCSSNVHDQTPISLCLSRGFTRCTDFLLNHERFKDSVSRELPSPFHNGFYVLIIGYVRLFYNWLYHLAPRSASGDNYNNTAQNPSHALANKRQTNSPIPTDVALAIAKAKENYDPASFRSLDPPEDLQIALQKAGMITNRNDI